MQNVNENETNNGSQTAQNSAPQVTPVVEQKADPIVNKPQGQVQDLGKQTSEQLQNLGQAGMSQLGGAMGKIINPTDQKQNQPPVKQEEKIYAAIAYVPFVAILSIIVKPDSAFVRLHCKQGLLLSILFFFIGILAAVVALFGIIGQLLAFVLGLVPLACFVIGVYSMYLAFNGYWWKIPVLASLADLIPIEIIAKTSKENITGQVGVAKNDYDNRQDTLKSVKTDATPVQTAMPVQQPSTNPQPEVKTPSEQANGSNGTGTGEVPKSN